jgi:predicted MFS family arabinose efflux permease
LRPDARLLALACGNFALGTASMSLVGLLNEVVDELGLPLAQAGQLTGASYLMAGVLAPVIAFVTRGLERRTVLLLALATTVAAQVAAALVAGFWGLFGARLLLGCGIAAHAPTAAATSSLLVKPEQRGSAISLVMVGFAVAGVAGVPLGVWFGGLFGWRATMLASAATIFCTLVWVWFSIPGQLPRSAADLSAIGRALKNRLVRGTLFITVAMSVGQMTVFTYFAPLLRQAVGAGPGTIALLMSVLGMSSIVGGAIGVRFMDRARPPRMMRIAAVMVVAGMLVWPLAQGSMAMCTLMVTLWGAGSMLMFSSVTTQMLMAGQDMANVSMALNTSANLLGSLAGASAGGLLLSLFGLNALPWGCILVYIGIACAVPLLTRQAARA